VEGVHCRHGRNGIGTDGEGVYATAASDGPEGSAERGGQDANSVDMPRIILVADATRAFGKAGIDAQIVHDVHVESLKDFAEVRGVVEVVGALL
jgi:hypothetical protein